MQLCHTHTHKHTHNHSQQQEEELRRSFLRKTRQASQSSSNNSAGNATGAKSCKYLKVRRAKRREREGWGGRGREDATNKLALTGECGLWVGQQRVKTPIKRARRKERKSERERTMQYSCNCRTLLVCPELCCTILSNFVWTSWPEGFYSLLIFVSLSLLWFLRPISRYIHFFCHDDCNLYVCVWQAPFMFSATFLIYWWVFLSRFPSVLLLLLLHVVDFSFASSKQKANIAFCVFQLNSNKCKSISVCRCLWRHTFSHSHPSCILLVNLANCAVDCFSIEQKFLRNSKC